MKGSSAKAAVETVKKWCSEPENSNEFELFATNFIKELDVEEALWSMIFSWISIQMVSVSFIWY